MRKAQKVIITMIIILITSISCNEQKSGEKKDLIESSELSDEQLNAFRSARTVRIIVKAEGTAEGLPSYNPDLLPRKWQN
jgi:hypothetical protein